MPGITSNTLNLLGKSATLKEDWGFPAQVFFVSTALVLLRHPRALHTVIPATSFYVIPAQAGIQFPFFLDSRNSIFLRHSYEGISSSSP